MTILARTLFILTLLFSISLAAAEITPLATTKPVPIAQLADFSAYPKAVQDLITTATSLSKMHLTYLYGSADPQNKGMDCSGTIYYLLTQKNLNDVPRQSDELFDWVEKKANFIK